jgi:hypothetical protein
MKSLTPLPHSGLFSLSLVVLALTTSAGVGATELRPKQLSLQGCPFFLRPLVDRMMLDLPTYTNRAIQQQATTPGVARTYVLVAGQAAYRHIDINPKVVDTQWLNQAQQAEPGEVRQLFLTTLERRYSDTGWVTYQGYHWAFFELPDRAIDHQWQLLGLISQTGPYPNPALMPTYPAIDATQSPLAFAIRHWLYDCRTGKLRRNPEESTR